jgi:hypothetical protein
LEPENRWKDLVPEDIGFGTVRMDAKEEMVKGLWWSTKIVLPV